MVVSTTWENDLQSTVLTNHQAKRCFSPFSLLAMITSFSWTERAFLEIAIANKSCTCRVCSCRVHANNCKSDGCARGVGYVLKGCKLDGRGQNFSTHYPEVHGCSVHRNQKIMYGTIRKHNCVPYMQCLRTIYPNVHTIACIY